MAKAQAHFRLDPDLLEAIKTRAETENITTTDLVTRFLKQGLGLDIHTDIQNIDTKIIEEDVYQRISERITNEFMELEKRISKRIPNDASDLKFIEKTVYERVSERVESKLIKLENRIADNISDLKNIEENVYQRVSEHMSNKLIELENRIANQILNINNRLEQEIPKPTPNKIKDKAKVNDCQQTNVDINDKHGQIKIQTLNLFDIVLNKQVMSPGELAAFLNEKTNSNYWNIHKLKNIRLRQLTWIKNYNNSEKESNKESPLPLIVENYMIDWIISDSDKDTATGKQWWIKQLPEDKSEIKNLTKERKEKYITHFNLAK